ncbi:MAG: type II toxin-antitoxin system HicB family antitoxin [Cyanobacteria bacterium QH_9_48_43]|nr:MAG: type II toxin-antitoxin system HicB family antitoxin [Cyanobacteria bacterium QH_9_48_43]
MLLYPDKDGYIVAEVPSLPGYISQGKTREQALTNIQEAMNLHIEVLQARGETLIP